MFIAIKDPNLLQKDSKNQEATYNFRLGFALSKHPYFISYRRSCQNRSDEHCNYLLLLITFAYFYGFLAKLLTFSLLIFQEDVEEEAEVENESEAKPSTPSTRGGRGRGAGTARRSRGRRGGAP